MKPVSAVSFLALALAACPLPAQPKPPTGNPVQGIHLAEDPHFRLMYENDDIQVYELTVPAHQSTLLDSHGNSSLFVMFDQSTVSVQSPGQAPVQLTLPDGAVRYSAAGVPQTLANDAAQPFHALVIVFLNPRLTARGCSCNGGSADAICECPNSQPLPSVWSKRIGQVELQGVTLAPGATFEDTSTRTTRFLVAITPLDILDSSIHEPKNLKVLLPKGRFHWLSPGPHTIQNLGSQPIRFVSVEFYGTEREDD